MLVYPFDCQLSECRCGAVHLNHWSSQRVSQTDPIPLSDACVLSGGTAMGCTPPGGLPLGSSLLSIRVIVHPMKIGLLISSQSNSTGVRYGALLAPHTADHECQRCLQEDEWPYVPEELYGLCIFEEDADVLIDGFLYGSIAR